MSLTTLQYLKAHERDYNTDELSSAVPIDNAVKAVAANCLGLTEYDWSGNDVGFVTLERRGWQLSHTPTLVSDAVGVGSIAVGDYTDTFPRPTGGLFAGGAWFYCRPTGAKHPLGSAGLFHSFT